MLAAVLALALSSAPVPRLVLHSELGASLPTRLLAQLARTKAMDSIMGAAASPASAQLFPCTTGAGVGTWQGPTCFTAFLISPSGSTSTAPSQMGWTSWAAGNGLQLELGDLGTTIQTLYGDRLQISAYHGIVMAGGRGVTTAPAFQSGGGSADPSVTIVASSSGGALRIDGASATGTPISSSMGVSVVVSNVPAAANTCTSLATVAISGSALGATCETSQTADNGSPDSTCVMRCGTTVAGTVALYCCNVGAAHNVTGNWHLRIWNN